MCSLAARLIRPILLLQRRTNQQSTALAGELGVPVGARHRWIKKLAYY